MSEETKALTVVEPSEMAARFLPVFDTRTALNRYQAFKDFVANVLQEGVDYGTIPGSEKKTLLKPGAEKLCTLFGLVTKTQVEEQIEDWQGRQYGEPLFYYRFKCQLYRGDFLMGEGTGACSSWESKYRYRWVTEDVAKRSGFDLSKLQSKDGRISEFAFAVEKKQVTGQYGKPKEYWDKWDAAIESGAAVKTTKSTRTGEQKEAWEMGSAMYRVPNTDFADIINTVLKIAKKRAVIDATLGTTNASDYFTQDIEDYIDAEVVPVSKIDIGDNKPNTQAAADYVAKQKLAAIEAEKQAQAKREPGDESEHAATEFDLINEVMTKGTREAKIEQLKTLADGLVKVMSADEAAEVFEKLCTEVGIRNVQDIRTLNQGRTLAKNLYYAIKNAKAGVIA